jgi:hypothetical protein
MHLIIAKYENDAERKRIEYILDKWKESLRVTKPDGIMAIIEGEGLEELLEDLYSRTSRSNVSLYRLEKEAVQIEKGESEIKLKINEKKETVEKLIGFVIAKQKGVLKREIKEPFERVYEVATKKGRAEISVSLRDEGQSVALRLKITGYGEVVEFLNTKLSEELSYLGGK